MRRERFLVKAIGDNEDAVRAGLVKILQILDKESHGVIVVPEMGKVKGTMLVDVLGPELANQLIKNREITFSDKKKLSLCSPATLKNFRHADAYLALWGSDHTIRDIEALANWKSAVLVTWAPKDSEPWQKESNVVVIYDDGKG